MIVELRSIDGGSFIAFTDWEVDDFDFGFKAAIAVRDRDFAGAHDEVWFSHVAFVAFVEALRRFSVAHEGEARLESMSPGEVVLSIRRLDLARHVLVEAQVSRGYYLRGHYFVDRVSVEFELDPSQLHSVVRGLAGVNGETEPS